MEASTHKRLTREILGKAVWTEISDTNSFSSDFCTFLANPFQRSKSDLETYTIIHNIALQHNIPSASTVVAISIPCLSDGFRTFLLSCMLAVPQRAHRIKVRFALSHTFRSCILHAISDSVPTSSIQLQLTANID